MIISLYYYLRVIKAMFIDENESPVEKIHVDALPATAMFICAAAILCIGFAGFIYNYIYSLSPAF
jgi:NADH-quinone oxidoreductase subunit N